MDTDKAYLLGLIIGGGVFGNAEDVFRIRLPFKKWGSYKENPKRAGGIATDILKKVGQMFRVIYGINTQYEAYDSYWDILCEGDLSPIVNDLSYYGVSCCGEIRGAASIRKISFDLVDDNLKRRFIAGLADTIGSMSPSHRRFSNEHQILSFEIKGCNFQFVCDLCRLLYSINCIPDQINWNHPNIHCTNDSYYTKWNKGFKLRILLDQYAKFGAFAFKTKVESAIENRKLQQQSHEAESCENRDFHITPSCIHPGENDKKLPEAIRGGHYIHFRHFCAVLGCEHAPLDKIKSCFSKLGHYINPFALLHKDTTEEISKIIYANKLFANRTYTVYNKAVSSFLAEYKSNKSALVYGNDKESGYPLATILQAIAFIIADTNELFGKRPKNNYVTLIEKHLIDTPDLQISIRIPDLLTPLILSNGEKSAMVGPLNPSVYKKLASISEDNEYKILVREITEEDLIYND